MTKPVATTLQNNSSQSEVGEINKDEFEKSLQAKISKKMMKETGKTIYLTPAKVNKKDNEEDKVPPNTEPQRSSTRHALKRQKLEEKYANTSLNS